MSRVLNFKRHAISNMMDIEIVLEEIYTEAVKGLDEYFCFDGGAHRGFHTIRFARLPHCSSVIAVEADPIMVENLYSALNRALPDISNITVVEAALQRDPSITSIAWTSSSSHDGRSSIISSNNELPTIWSEHTDMQYRDSTNVPATTIDKIIRGIVLPLPFLKLDLEGADLSALFGARDTLVGKRPIVAFENSSKSPAVHGFTIDEVLGYFQGVGYVPMNFAGEPLTRNNWFSFWEAWAAPRERAHWLANQLSAALERRGF